MIFITGDTHCPIDIHKLNKKNFDDSNMTKDDYLIICGDAGLVWQGRDGEDKYWQRWLSRKKFTTLFVDGNHENHNKLDKMPIEMWHGGKVHKLNDSIIHLMRGQVFTIDGLKFFTMGGAESTDKQYRKENVTWWSREMPSTKEYIEAVNNVAFNNYEVDYIITHTAPTGIQKELCDWYNINKLNVFLETVDVGLKFKHWYFGHYHDDRKIDEKHTLVYEKIINIGDNNEAN